VFAGSEQVKASAKSRGKVPEEKKLIMSGLPIRHTTAVQAETWESISLEGKAYQRKAMTGS
jgi:hypothetical protein